MPVVTAVKFDVALGSVQILFGVAVTLVGIAGKAVTINCIGLLSILQFVKDE